MIDYKYKGSMHEDGVIRYSDGASIECEDANVDWQGYLQYSVGGGITDPYKTFDENKTDRYNGTNTECDSYILEQYPILIQLSMASKIYPESVTTPYRLFVADCIEASNNARGLILLATTQEELDAINPTWPEVPTNA